MEKAPPVIRLKPIIRCREFPFGTAQDSSMREAMAERPWENQDKVLQYLRSGVILSIPMGADLTDWFDRPNKANPVIEGRTMGGTMDLTDGEWFWYAGLIYFIEKYNVRVPAAFVQHAARHGWLVDREAVPPAQYDYSYFES